MSEPPTAGDLDRLARAKAAALPAGADRPELLALRQMAEGGAAQDRAAFERAARRLDMGLAPFRAGFGEEAAEELLAILLCREALGSTEAGPGVSLKRINVALKAIDRVAVPELSTFARAGGPLESAMRTAIPAPRPASTILHRPLPLSDRVAPRTLPLTILFHEGPIARAYLTALAAAGLRPQRIVDLVAIRDIATGRRVGRWLPAPMRLDHAAWVQRQRIHHWPRAIAKQHPDFREALLAAAAATFSIPLAAIDDAAALRPLRHYAEEVVRIPFERFSDDGLVARLRPLFPGAILYTGGGILPAALLEGAGARFLHVHPGFLPDIRGADGALWSMLIAGRLSASCFYMAPEIDAGEIVMARWLPDLALDRRFRQLPTQALYRGFYSYLDPWLRAATLRDVLLEDADAANLPAAPQAADAGTTFHFMHERLRELAFDQLFAGGRSDAGLGRQAR